MKIFLATDHAGYELKEQLKGYLSELEYVIEDMGAYEYNKSDDYPDFILPAVNKVAEDSANNRAIVFGGTGQGEAIAANKVSSVRAIVYYGANKEIVTLSREHNDANVLSLGARFISAEEAKEVAEMWLTTDFGGEERHKRRLEKIE